jgi:uncharacterized protein with ParB-like and HNH nuclease domain
MDNQLLSISKIFTEKLFRIPDYQRGYAWSFKQLKDFWNDIIQLEEDKNHYVGVLTLEIVPKNKWMHWEDDKWIIESKSYEPYYVVDGQQRLTTTIILIQCITELIGERKKLNYTSTQEIRKKFIFDLKDVGISRSYIFGYEKDNPSYEFLKTKIFLENVDGYRDEETIYTRNLENAKKFFTEKLSDLKKDEIGIIYKKTTQQLLFNIYTITDDIDVFVAFETMNNRGKPLSNLELLKNRLIYLSTKFNNEASEKIQLRKRINDSWKAVYHYLGRNKDRPLSDDFFLINHFIITFGNKLKEKPDNKYERANRYGNYNEVYANYLLEEKFTLKNIKSTEEDQLTIDELNRYILSLQEAVKVWYSIFNPTENKYYDDEEKLYLDKLYRLSPRDYSDLILAVYLKKNTKKLRIEFLKLLEQYAFLTTLSYRFDEINYKELTLELSKNGEVKLEAINKILEQSVNKIRTSKDFIESISSRFKGTSFYKWREVRYFLYEYELSLKEKSKSKRIKIDWNVYSSDKDDFITIEHIYPQKPKDTSWTSIFKYHHTQNDKLCHSLGNLLPLSKPKIQVSKIYLF